MKKLLSVCLLALCLFQLHAAVKPGENILLNGKMEARSADPETNPNTLPCPLFWSPTRFMKAFAYNRNGSPDGTGSMKLFAPDPNVKTPEVTFRQSGFKLVPNETYRISALVRTKNFTASACGLVVYSDDWTADAGFQSFPPNQDWTRMTTDITMVGSKSGIYSIAAHANQFTGFIEFADIRLEAVSAKALEGSSGSESQRIITNPRLIPWSPRLNAIVIPPYTPGKPAAAPEISFRFFGFLPEGTTLQDYDALCSVNGRKPFAASFQNSLATFRLAGFCVPEDITLNVSLVSRKTRKPLFTREFSATLIEQPHISTEGHRRLNNLVVQLFRAHIFATPAPQTCVFSTVRNGWVYIAAHDAKGENLNIVLDGKQTVIRSTTPRLETFRVIPAGRHTLTVSGAVNGPEIIVHSIPEIYSFAPGVDSRIENNPHYDWEFEKKHVLHGVTTQNGGVIPGEAIREFLDAGYKWVSNSGTVNATPESLIRILNTCDGLNNPWYQGVSCDEQGFNSLESLMPYIVGLKKFTPKNNRPIYNWIVNYPTIPGIHHEFIAECLNTARGNGRLLTEVYCPTFATQKEAMDYFSDHILKSAAAYRSFYPGTLNQWGIILGAYSQVPIISLSHYPHVDFKYYLDLQLNLIANSPECKDMAITGFWGSYHCNEELHRWAFMLSRHYCVEGKKTMLSDEYGFSYAPGHIQNGDFENNCEGWTVKGSVSSQSVPRFGLQVQNRYSAHNGIGDSMAVFAKQGEDVSSVTQTARNLIPGKTYCLEFFTADYNDVKARKINPRQNGLSATLGDGAQIDAAQSWVFVDRRIKGRYAHNDGVARGNLHHIVFKATRPEVTITIDNAKAANGEVLCCNYVSLNPYLD